MLVEAFGGFGRQAEVASLDGGQQIVPSVVDSPDAVPVHQGEGCRRMKSIDFVGRVPADHVQDCFVATGVVLDPCVDLEDVIVLDDDSPSLCDERSNLAACHDRVVSSSSGRRHVEGCSCYGGSNK